MFDTGKNLSLCFRSLGCLRAVIVVAYYFVVGASSPAEGSCGVGVVFGGIGDG